jgi:hypothetical protein
MADPLRITILDLLLWRSDLQAALGTGDTELALSQCGPVAVK